MDTKAAAAAAAKKILRKTGVAQVAEHAKAAEKKPAKSAVKKTPAKKSKSKTTSTRRAIPASTWSGIVKMWGEGKSSSEISDKFGFTENGPWPYQYTLGLLKRLKKGVEVDGKTYKIKGRSK